MKLISSSDYGLEEDKMKKSNVLKDLIEEVRELENHPRNLRIKQFWVSIQPDKMPRERRIPPLSSEVEAIPFTVELEPDMWGEILGFNLKRFFTDATCYLENTLRKMIYRFKVFRDFTPVDTIIPIWFGSVLESSLFGVHPIFKENQCPWIAREPLIKDYTDLKNLSTPDFYNSGLMPLAHRMYHEMQELAGDDLRITLPQWFRGPFGVASHLRGVTNVLADLYLNPQFVHDLLRFLTDARKEWYVERAHFLDCSIEPGVLSNDEVNSPSLSPRLYEEFILPYERELCEFHNGIVYWHSCGNTTELVASINKIPKLTLFHIGPWTDMAKTRESMRKGTAFEKVLMPTEDVYFATPDQMRAQIYEIRRVMDGSAYSVRADAFQIVRSLEEDLAKIRSWSEIAREELRRC